MILQISYINNTSDIFCSLREFAKTQLSPMVMLSLGAGISGFSLPVFINWLVYSFLQKQCYLKYLYV